MSDTTDSKKLIEEVMAGKSAKQLLTEVTTPLTVTKGDPVGVSQLVKAALMGHPDFELGDMPTADSATSYDESAFCLIDGNGLKYTVRVSVDY